MSPLEAAQREITAELDALARRLGSAPVPDAIVIRIEMDRATGMPRAVECQEERSRRILGSPVATSKRCTSAA